MSTLDEVAVGWNPPVDATRLDRPEPGSGPRLSARRLARLRASDDAQLVEACQAGEPEAFEVIVERYQRRLYVLCYRFAGGHEEASDLAQDALVRAYRGLRRFRRQASLSTWLHRIAVNVCLSRLVSRKGEAEPLEPDRLRDGRAVDPTEAILRRQRSVMLRSAIARLPKRQRAVVVLRVYHDLSHEEIAGILGSSTGAVKVNFCHALRRLRGELGGAGLSGAGGGR